MRITPVTGVTGECIVRYGPVKPTSRVKDVVLQYVKNEGGVFKCSGMVIPGKLVIDSISVSSLNLYLRNSKTGYNTQIQVQDVLKMDISSSDPKAMKMKSKTKSKKKEKI